MLDDSAVALSGARVTLFAANGTGPLPYQESVTITSSGTTATVTHTTHGLATNDFVRILGANEREYNGTFQITVTGPGSYTYTLPTSTTSPATGTITSTGCLFNTTTNGSGEVTDSRTWGSAQPLSGWVRKSTTQPYFREAPLSGTISTSLGLSLSVQMISDE